MFKIVLIIALFTTPLQITSVLYNKFNTVWLFLFLSLRIKEIKKMFKSELFWKDSEEFLQIHVKFIESC